MDTIRARCFTNIDDFKRFDWPTEFAVVPQRGDYVQGKGAPPVTQPTLKVVGITHCQDNDGPWIRVELHR